MIRIPGVAMQCLWVIFRKTYGWNKIEETITNQQFQEMTGQSKVAVSKAINKLLELGLVTKNGNKKNISYCFQKDYDKWVLLPKKVTSGLLPKKVTTVTKNGNKNESLLPKKVPPINNKTIIKTKKKISSFVFLSVSEFGMLVADYGLTWTMAAIRKMDEYIPLRDKEPYKDFYKPLRRWTFDAVNKDGEFDSFLKAREIYISLKTPAFTDYEVSQEMIKQNFRPEKVVDVVRSFACQRPLTGFDQYASVDKSVMFILFHFFKTYFGYNDAEALGYMFTNQFYEKEKLKEIVRFYGGKDKMTGFEKYREPKNGAA